METWDITAHDVAPHQPAVLHSEVGGARVILINLPGGETMADHEVHEHAFVHVHSGEVELEQDGRTTTAAAGALAYFRPHERHELRAKSDARVLLILAPWPGEGRDLDFNA